MKIFKSNYTKWLPFGINTHGYTHYMVFVRKNKKTGMLYFKSKKIQISFFHNTFINIELIDIKEAWNKIIQE